MKDELEVERIGCLAIGFKFRRCRMGSKCDSAACRANKALTTKRFILLRAGQKKKKKYDTAKTRARCFSGAFLCFLAVTSRSELGALVRFLPVTARLKLGALVCFLPVTSRSGLSVTNDKFNNACKKKHGAVFWSHSSFKGTKSKSTV